MRVAAIVPAWNEADRITGTVAALRSIPAVSDVVVIDDGSTDETAERAREAGARVIRSRKNQGKGAAVAAGIARVNADILLLVDGDLAASASFVDGLLGPVISGKADMTIAAPPPGGPSGFGLVENLARRGIRSITGRSFHRPLSGQRCLRREVVADARLPRGFGLEIALTVHALTRGFRVAEVVIPVEHRRTGRDLRGFLHRGRQGVAVAWELVRRGVRLRR